MNPDGDQQLPVKKPVQVLVAEDSPLNQQVALKQLEKLGYLAGAVTDGRQVLEQLDRVPYDVILMDCQMPEMSGYEATWQIRDREKQGRGGAGPRRRVYIIAMTANTKSDSREKCLHAGMDDFIGKPVQLPELEAALQRAMADRSAQDALEQVIDPVVIAGLRQLRMPGKPDPVVEFIDLFLKEAPSQIEAMQQSIAANNESSLARLMDAAIALKGSASNLGAVNLAALCDEVEQSAKIGLLADALPVVEKARAEFARAKEVLDRIKTEAAE